MNLIGADKGNYWEFAFLVDNFMRWKLSKIISAQTGSRRATLLNGTDENWVKELVESDVIGVEREKVKNILGDERK